MTTTDDFVVTDGWLTDRWVVDLAAWYTEHCKGVDTLDFETHLAVLRAFSTLTVDSPLETIGGLSRARYNILRMLYQRPDRRLLMSEIVQGMNVSPTNITKLVDSLVADGFVRRVGHEQDKRRTWAELTEKGEDLLVGCIPQVGQHIKRLWGCLEDSEKTVLVHLLSKMRLNSQVNSPEESARVMRDFARAQAKGVTSSRFAKEDWESRATATRMSISAVVAGGSGGSPYVAA
jgi:DNA-binding MarR family transcriptional regulator